MFLPQLKQKRAQQAVTNVFAGINRAQEIGDGEFSKAMNLSTREFPMLCPRKPRGIGATITDTYHGILEKNGKAVLIVGSSVRYGDETIGITVSEDAGMLPKRMVSMGAYVLIFPDKVYFNSIDTADCGSIEAAYSSEGPIAYTMCRLDGSDFGNVTKRAEPPEDPDNGAYWIDTGSTPHKMMMYSALTGIWEQIQTVYTRITAQGINEQVRAGDTVVLSGISAGTGVIKEQLEGLNGTQYIYDAGDNYITVLGLLDGTAQQTEGSISAERKCPDMDFVIEESNRLWGCHYGTDENGETLNEIYACKLGDFRNWRVYQGISTDSYTVSIGSDGPFTGAIAYGGMPMFFKRDCVHKIYGNKPSNYQAMTTQMHGVAAGSENSLVNVDGTIFYLSDFGIETFDGSLPQRISQALGEGKMSAGVAGAIGGRYYICVTEDDENRHLYVFDAQRRIWLEESTEGVKAFANIGTDLYMLMEHRIDTALGSEGQTEGLVAWYAETGMIGWERHNKSVMGAAEDKYITRYQLRAFMPVGSRMRCLLRYGQEKEWLEKLSVQNEWESTETMLMPVYPRRCDYMRMRIEGTGAVKLHSITRTISGGGDGKHG